MSFVDGRDIKATVIGRDKHTDVAVLKVEEKAPRRSPLGDSDTIEVGDWVVAIGNPFGLSPHGLGGASSPPRAAPGTT